MPRKVKSSLVDHHFPRFYACYLLKSIRTPRATATYIGSTPSPPRRIRQHNGEITQGAWKTKHNRPWFEWAWQHPHISRHLRSENGEAVFQMNSMSRYLSRNVSIARSMICSHPYNTWPLHVKLFTTEAEKAWNDASRDCSDAPLPQGFTCTTELEGVDGKSGKVGIGRTGAIDVNDSAFTSEHLSKWTTLLASAKQLQCTMCEEALSRQHLDPLNIAFCPTPNCTATSHLACLSSEFLQHERTANTASGTLGMIPRGGECRSCRTYVLWGDIIRGCYRRRGDDAPEMESDNDEDPPDQENQSSEDAYNVSPSPRHCSRKTLGKKSTKRHGAAAQKKRSTIWAQGNSSEGEFFDINNVSGDSEDDVVAERPLGATSRRGKTSEDDPALVRPVGRSTVDKGHLTKATRTPDTVRDRREPLLSHVARKAPRRIGAAERRCKAANAAEDTLSLQANAPTSLLDEGLAPLGSPRHQVPYLKAVPSYVEIDSAESSSCEPDDAGQGALTRYSQSRRGSIASDAQPEGSSSEADGFGSPGHLGSPRGRLSRALSTLSISSGSELPDMVHILRDLEKKKQDGDDDVIVVSD